MYDAASGKPIYTIGKNEFPQNKNPSVTTTTEGF
jgi:hypothetical protein